MLLSLIFLYILFLLVMGTVQNHLFICGAISDIIIAEVGKHAENIFSKPSGLLDQMSTSLVPLDDIPSYAKEMEFVFGKERVFRLNIRPVGRIYLGKE